MTPKGKLSKLFTKKIVIVKNMKDLLLDSIPKTMEAQDIFQEWMNIIDEKVLEKTITHTNIEGEHNDDDKDNLNFANDDDNINVNILHLCFSYWQRKLSLMTILIYSLEAWKVCKKLDLEKFQFWFCLTIFLFLLHLKNLKKMQGV